jgi:glycosyltransferase involved in cell wall biosynthesis
MKILVFYPYIPYPVDRGTYQRTFHLLRALARDHEVDLLALSEKGENMEHKAVFESFCREVEFVSFEHPKWQKLFPDRLLNPLPSNVAHWTLPHVAEALAKRLAREKYDLVHVCDLVLAQYFIKAHPEQRISVDRSRVDLQFQLMEHARMQFPLKTRLLRYENYAKLWAFERKIARRAAVEVVCGPDDEVFLRARIDRDMPIKVVANGVDLDYFQPDSAPDARAEKPTVLFCGAMDYNPNIDALRWYFGEVHEKLKARVPELEVLIVGKAPVDEVKAHGKLTGVTVTGGVPDVRPYYRRSWLQIVPLRIGGGTRLKIVESMAIGTPVVSTTIGAQGLDLKHGDDILLADTAEDFASETARALQDTALRSRVEHLGMQTARERLSWPMLGQQLSDYYTEKFGGGRKSSTADAALAAAAAGVA